jgi:hypothetical protein
MSTPTRPVVFSAYDPASIASMADILWRASRNRAIAALEVALIDVVHWTGIGREDTERAALWHEGERDNHREIAQQFATMADAPNPLDPSLCTAALRPELNGMIHNRWSTRWRREGRGDHASIRGISWQTLTAREQVEIGDMARSLSAFHKSMAPARCPRKDDIDTALLLLAEIFAVHTGCPRDHRELPHSAGSHFILFAREALEPFFDPSETTTKALKGRWQRQKMEFRDARSGPDA